MNEKGSLLVMAEYAYDRVMERKIKPAIALELLEDIIKYISNPKEKSLVRKMIMNLNQHNE